MQLDYTKPVKVDGVTGVCSVDAVGYEYDVTRPVVRGPIREFLGMFAPATVAMIVVAALVMLAGCGSTDGEPSPEPGPVASAPVASAKPDKAKLPAKILRACKPFPAKYRPMCAKVYAQHPFGSADADGGMWSAPAGPVIIAEITGQGLAMGEMIDYLKGARRDYLDNVVRVPLNMDRLKAKCGYDGQYVVKFLDEDGRPGGRKLTQIITDCP